MMLRTGRLTLLALLASCAGSQPKAPVPVGDSDAVRPADQPPLPRSVLGLQVSDTFTFDEANSGVQYRYAGEPAFRPDVYLYPLTPQGHLCTAGCPVEAARVEADDFKANFPIFIERGYADSIVLVSESEVPPPTQSWVGRGRHIQMRMVRHGTTLESHFFIFAGREVFLKVRATFPPSAANAQVLDAFLPALLAATSPPYSCHLGLTSDPGISVSTTRFGATGPVAHTLDSLLVHRAAPLDYRSEESGNWRTLPQFGPLPGSSTGATQAGVVLFARVTAKGDSATATLTGQNACRTPSSKVGEESASVGPLLMAIQTMAALDSALGH